MPGAGVLAALRAAGASSRPPRSSEAAVRAWVGDAELAAACHQASGGNPFLLGALLDELGPDPDVARVRSAGPVAVQRSLLLRLARLGPAAIALAQAVAILERDARLVAAAALAELDEPAARAAADALIAARVLDAAHPLRFAHPVLRAAVYADVGLTRRAAGHRRAAELLDAEAPDRAALHLLATHPSGDPWVLERLRAAADRALAQGSTGGARALLERALEEAPSDPETLLALGEAERRSGGLGAAARLEQALAIASDAPLRTRIARELAALRWAQGGVDAAIAVLDAELPRASAARAGGRPSRVRRARRTRAPAGRWPRPCRDARRRHAGRAPDARHAGVPPHDLGRHHRRGGRPAGRTSARRRAAARGRRPGPSERPRRALDAAGGRARRRRRSADRDARAAAPVEAAVLRAMRARLALFRGDLRAAEAAAREVLTVAADAGLEHVRRFTVPTLVMILVERGELEEAETELAAAEAVRHDGTLWLMLQARSARPRPRAGPPRPRRARARAAVERRRHQRARCGGAGAAHSARTEEARAVAAPRRDARRWAVPSTLGMALRAQGLVTASWSRCVRPSTRSPRRRGGSSMRGRAWIWAPRCGAPTGAPMRARSWPRAWSSPTAVAPTPLAARAREELVACGARPRRLVRTGVDALTPSELRVAQLAAAGHSNREIAQALFVTRKTVETHLGGIYRKLGVNAREQLAGKLQDPPPDAKPRRGPEAVAP